jgi:hypothetical protein
MAWIESHQELRNHPKTKRLARQLGISIAAAIGHLHLFWWWAMDYADNGDLSNFNPEDLADAAGWDGDAQAFVEAMITCGPGETFGFIDKVDGKLHIHDWEEYIGKVINRRKKNAEYVKKSKQRSSERNSASNQKCDDNDELILNPEKSKNELSASAAMNQDEEIADSKDGNHEVSINSCLVNAGVRGRQTGQTGQTDRQDITPPSPPGVCREEKSLSQAEAVKDCSKGMIPSGIAEDDAGASPAQGLLFDDPDVSAQQGAKHKTKPPACPHEAIVALYHEILPELPKTREWSKGAKDQLHARWSENAKRQSLGWWREYFESIRGMDWLMGRIPSSDGRESFKADLLWLVGVKNMAKVFSGRYRRGKSGDMPYNSKNRKGQSLEDYMRDMGDDPLGLHTGAEGGVTIL